MHLRILKGGSIFGSSKDFKLIPFFKTTDQMFVQEWEFVRTELTFLPSNALALTAKLHKYQKRVYYCDNLVTQQHLLILLLLKSQFMAPWNLDLSTETDIKENEAVET